jgi:hypothetical protein
LSSARISRRFSGFCSLCERMYSHICGRQKRTARLLSVEPSAGLQRCTAGLIPRKWLQF